VAAALASGWEATTLRATDTGGPSFWADNGSTQVVVADAFSGCCFKYTELFVNDSGTWQDLAESTDLGLPFNPGAQPLFDGGPMDLIVDETQNGGTNFVAVGATMDDLDQTLRPTVWRSTDGRSWTTSPIVNDGNRFDSVVTAGGGLIATVQFNRRGIEIWNSSDGGSSWLPDGSIDVSQAINDAVGAGMSEEPTSVDRIGSRLVIHTDGGLALFQSLDDGGSWSDQLDGFGGGSVMFADGAALRFTSADTHRTLDGENWHQIPGPPPDLFGCDCDFTDLSGIHALQLGDVTVLWNGRDFMSTGHFWVADSTTPWIPVFLDPAFGDGSEGPTHVNQIGMASDGSLVAIGWIPVPFTGNKPLEDYMIWTHQPVD